ncbi:MAG: hypothetical protein Ct9H300mP28_26280 [Pseudomonadota bacterium]|nr:MAG: hypothetical protein Ct9H300mP28_26280 [Pseudomonadota bacterium]
MGIASVRKPDQNRKRNKRNVWNPSIDAKEEILKDVIGPSGNLRAPTWRVGPSL